MARFVLVAGAWHGAWCWEYVTPLLEARGHRVQTAELPGMGEDRTPLANLDMMAWAGAVAKVVEAFPERPILVGHSRGGAVISQTAELIPDRVRLNVYLSGLLLGDGECGADITSMVPEGTLRPREFILTADGHAFTIDRDSIAEGYQHSENALIDRVFARLTPEPCFGLLSSLSLSDGRYGRVPRAYVECLDDLSIPIGLQRAMQLRQSCAHVRSIDTDHCPTYSAPELLAETLDELVSLA
jgi:pimeloyl-ACP methyl ester carboxylesterase